MALPAFGIDSLVKMDLSSLNEYFANFARYIQDAPLNGPHYAIRVGTRNLYDNDTDELRKKFIRRVGTFKMRRAKGQI